MKVGRHCCSDYSITVTIGMVPNPWAPYPLYLPPDFKPTHFNYTAAGMVPHIIFGFLGKWMGAPRLGLLGYLLVLTIAVFTAAVWASRGARGLERVVVFVECGAAANSGVGGDRSGQLGGVPWRRSDSFSWRRYVDGAGAWSRSWWCWPRW